MRGTCVEMISWKRYVVADTLNRASQSGWRRGRCGIGAELATNNCTWIEFDLVNERSELHYCGNLTTFWN